MEITAAPFQDEGVTSIHVVLNDITERKKAEARAKAALEALKTSEEKFRKAFITSPDAININRFVRRDVRLDQQRLHPGDGLPGGRDRRAHIARVDIWADAEDRRRLVEGLRNNGEVENLEARFRRKNGELGVGLMSAVVIEIDRFPTSSASPATSPNASGPRRLSGRVKPRLRNIFENIQDVYYETALDGTVLEISPSIRSLSGGQFPGKTSSGKSIQDFYAHPEDRAPS